MRRAVGAHRIHHDFTRQLASLLHFEAHVGSERKPLKIA
jgi:hypothetical protein